MDMNQLPDYKGFKIFVNSYGTFVAQDEENEKEAEADTLRLLHEKLDKISKKQIRKDVYVRTYRNDFAAGVLTSIKETRSGMYGEKFVLKVTVDGTSRQYDQNELYARTPENDVLMQKYIALNAERDRLATEAAELMKQMTRISLKEILAPRHENSTPEVSP